MADIKVAVKSKGFSVAKKPTSISIEERQVVALESIAASLGKLVSFHEVCIQEIDVSELLGQLEVSEEVVEETVEEVAPVVEESLVVETEEVPAIEELPVTEEIPVVEEVVEAPVAT